MPLKAAFLYRWGPAPCLLQCVSPPPPSLLLAPPPPAPPPACSSPASRWLTLLLAASLYLNSRQLSVGMFGRRRRRRGRSCPRSWAERVHSPGLGRFYSIFLVPLRTRAQKEGTLEEERELEKQFEYSIMSVEMRRLSAAGVSGWMSERAGRSSLFEKTTVIVSEDRRSCIELMCEWYVGTGCIFLFWCGWMSWHDCVRFLFFVFYFIFVV